MANCSTPSCSKDAVLKGYCRTHYPKRPSIKGAGKPRKSHWQRLWEKVDRSGGSSGCWIFKGGLGDGGYGVLGWKENGRQRSMSAHRMAWTLTNGTIPPGMCILHRCDNRKCVNPAHLMLGTQEENVRDMALKGRAYGKLSYEIAQEIRRRYAAGESQSKLAREFNVTQSSISQIVRNKTYVR